MTALQEPAGRANAQPPRRRLILGGLTGLVAFATFFIVEHSLTSSTRSEAFGDEEFEDVQLDEMVAGGDTIRKVGFVAFGAMGAALLVTPVRRLPMLSTPLLLIGAGATLAAASVLWAVDTNLAAKRVFVLACVLSGVLGLSRQFSPRQTANWLTALAAAFVILGLLAEVALGQFRPWSGEYRFGGTTHPNTQGVICGLLLCSAAARVLLPGGTNRGRWLLVALGTAVLLYLTKSRTTLAATLVACGVLAVLRASWAMRLIGGLSAAVAVSAAVLLAAALDLPVLQKVGDALLLGRQEEAGTLTGRLPLWAELNGDIAARPLLGHGYGSFWTPDTVYRVAATQGWQPSHAHSAYYETALNLGLPGLLLAVLTLTLTVLAAVQAEASRPSVASGLVLSFTIFAGIYSMADTAFALPTLASFTLAMLIVQSGRLSPVAASRQSRRAAADGSAPPFPAAAAA